MIRHFAFAALLALAGPVAAQDAPLSCRLVFDGAPPLLNACQGGERLEVAFVGDVLLHGGLQRRGYAEGFGAVWGAVLPFWASADIAVANLEGPVAPGFTGINRQGTDPGPVFGTAVYTSYPMFNYHPMVTQALAAGGVDIVTTSNNHSMDRGSGGFDATLDQVAAAGLVQVGGVRAGAARQFATVTDSPLGSLVWIACTYSTNGIADPYGQTLNCFQEQAALLSLIGSYAAQPGVAGVIVLPHWGDEYQPSPNRAQRALAAAMVGAGAALVVGTHPHVVQGWEVIQGPAGQVPVIYSTGNFVSGQPGLDRQTGLLAWVTLCRGAPSADLGQAIRARLRVAQAGWVPLRMGRDAGGHALFSVGTDGATGYVAEARNLIAGRIPGFEMGARYECAASGTAGTAGTAGGGGLSLALQ